MSFYFFLRVHGSWSGWGGWSACSVTCAGGSRSRSRSCTNPSPQYGGNACTGSSSDTEGCNQQPCPSEFFKRIVFSTLIKCV